MWKNFFNTPEWGEIKAQLTEGRREVVEQIIDEIGVDTKQYTLHDLRRSQIKIIDKLLGLENTLSYMEESARLHFDFVEHLGLREDL